MSSMSVAVVITHCAPAAVQRHCSGGEEGRLAVVCAEAHVEEGGASGAAGVCAGASAEGGIPVRPAAAVCVFSCLPAAALSISPGWAGMCARYLDGWTGCRDSAVGLSMERVILSLVFTMLPRQIPAELKRVCVSAGHHRGVRRRSRSAAWAEQRRERTNCIKPGTRDDHTEDFGTTSAGQSQATKRKGERDGPNRM